MCVLSTALHVAAERVILKTPHDLKYQVPLEQGDSQRPRKMERKASDSTVEQTDPGFWCKVTNGD